MTVNVTSLAAFKRFLALPGATVHCVRNDISARSGDAAWIARGALPRTVYKLQSKAVAWSIPGEVRPSWLYFNKASAFKFEGETVTYQPDAAKPDLIVYRLELVGGPA